MIPIQPKFETLDAFYNADAQRALSPEWDFGVMWRLKSDTDWPLYRVSWVINTGELYAVRLAAPNVTYVLGVVERAGEYPYGQPHEAWSRFKDAQPIEKVMEGWAEADPPLLGWVTARVASYMSEVGDGS